MTLARLFWIVTPVWLLLLLSQVARGPVSRGLINAGVPLHVITLVTMIVVAMLLIRRPVAYGVGLALLLFSMVEWSHGSSAGSVDAMLIRLPVVDAYLEATFPSPFSVNTGRRRQPGP
jgi:hypothetical protein